MGVEGLHIVWIVGR